MHTCLFSSRGHDLRPWLRAEVSVLRAEIATVWRKSSDRYSESRGGAMPDDAQPRIEMHWIGG